MGIIASYADVEGYSFKRIGLEAEAYLNKITIAAQAGYQTGTLKDTYFADADLRFYPLDDLMLEIGIRGSDEHTQGHAGAEFLTKFHGLALFADGAMGDGYEHVLAGIRVYFGRDKSLIRRHREDDLLNPLLNIITSTYERVDREKQKSSTSTSTTSTTSSDSSSSSGSNTGGFGD
ncbi:hypothetical protein [Desulfovulcanus sp.]